MKASFVTICFNSEKYIEDCILSVKNQTIQSFEHIVVDCGSTDGTKSILKKNKYSKLRVFFTDKCPISNARNYAINKAKGEIILILDSDDTSTRRRLEICLNEMKKDPELALIAGGVKKIESDRKDISALKWGELQRLLYCGINPIAHSAVAFRKDIFNQGKFYDESQQKCEDFDLYLRVCKKYKIKKINKIICNWRKSLASHTFRVQKNKRFYYIIQSLKKNQICKIKKTKNFKITFFQHMVKSFFLQSIYKNAELTSRWFKTLIISILNK